MTPGPIETFTAKSDGFHSLSVAGHTLGTTPSGGARIFGDPGQGNMYWGSSSDSLSSRETFLGQRTAMVRRYYAQSTGASLITAAAADITAGRIPWVSIKWDSPSRNWSQIASGDQDTWISAHFASLHSAVSGKGPILWTAHAEPDGDETTGSTASTHKDMYSHLVTLAASYPEIIITPCLALNYYDATTTGVKMSDWYPTTVGCLGFNSYNHISYSPANGKKNLTVAQAYGLQQAQAHALAAGKLWAVSEWGVRTNPSSAGQAATWMLDAYNFGRNNGCFGMTFYDSSLNVNDGGSHWTMDDTGDGTDGTERKNKYKVIALLSTSKLIPTGGLSS